MATNTLASNFSGDISTYIAAKTLSIALKQMAFYPLCDKVPLPKNSGRTFQYTRYDRLVLPQVKLTEGVTPADTSMSISTVNAVMDQWGAVIPISDVAIDSVKHPVLQKAINLAGHQSAETLDREITKIALSGSQVYYPGSSTSSRSAIASSDKLTSSCIGKVVSYMRDKGTMPFDDSSDLFVGAVDSFSEDDITIDSTFVDAAKYGMIKKLLVNEVGEWKGVRWVRVNTMPKLGLMTGNSGTGSATAGSLSASTTYNAVVTVVDAKTGFETFCSAVFNAATGGGQSSVAITLGALPSDATAGSTLNLYFGTNGGTLYLAKTGLAAGGSANQGVVPTSGDVAPASPNSGFKTHFAVVLGKEALACIELNKIRSYLTPATPSDSDPLVQRRKVGWKADFRAMITNDDFIARIEHATTNGN